MKVKITERANGSRRVAMETAKTTRVEQSHRDKCNINSIMRKASETGLVPTNNTAPNYGDFTNVQDYQTCKNRLLDAQRDFSELPSHIRRRFDNDPSKLIEFVNDPDSLEEARQLGLVTTPEPEPIIPDEPPETATGPPRS